MLKAKRILVAGGGTGGHLYPGLSLAAAIRAIEPECDIAFVGTRNGLESTLVPEAGFKLHFLSTGRGSPLSLRRPLNSLRFLKSFWECHKLFKAFPPDCVVSLGGFAASVPGLLAAYKKIPLVCLEQNVLPGRVTQLLSRWATQLHVQFAESTEHLTHGKGRIFPTGSPARADIVRLHAEKPKGNRLLVMGGSQGALRLNQLFCQAAQEILDAGIPVTHITGTRDYDWIAEQYRTAKGDLETIPYTEDMAAVYRRVRLAVARSGASSINELELVGLPSLLVPFPSARDDHQTVNAKVLEHAGAALLAREADLTPAKLARLIKDLWGNPALMDNMGASARKRARPQAAESVAGAVLSMLMK